MKNISSRARRSVNIGTTYHFLDHHTVHLSFIPIQIYVHKHGSDVDETIFYIQTINPNKIYLKIESFFTLFPLLFFKIVNVKRQIGRASW